MNVKNKILLYSLPFLALFMAKAQETWTLSRCISYSLENNLTLKNASLSYDAQQVNLSQARFNQLPQVSAQISMNESFGRTVDPGTNTYSNVSNFNNSYSIGTSVSLFSGFAQRNRIAFENFNLQAEKNRLEQQKNNVIYSVISAYYKFLLEEGIFRMATENLQLMQDQYFSTRRLIDVGRKAESDIYDFDAKLATDSFLLIQQEGNKAKAMLLLKKSMNYPFSDPLTIHKIQNIF
jgi:outer membrane protein